MVRRFMVGTVDDTPLLMITVGRKKYLVDLSTKEVLYDIPGIPRVTDESLAAKVFEAAEAKK